MSPIFKLFMNSWDPGIIKMAAIGGEPIDDIYGYFPEVNWYRLVARFLQTGIKQQHEP
jgi:hypothetical protein